MKKLHIFYGSVIVLLLAVILTMALSPAAAGVDLTKYDLNGDGVISIEDVSLLLNVLSGSVLPDPYSGGLEFSLTTDGSGYAVSGVGTCTDTKIVIPPTYRGKPVTGITNLKNTFANEVVIPDSVTFIGRDAFYFCTAMKSLTLPDSVISIGEYAFYNCTGLKNIVIPDSVTSLGWGVFENCTGLTGVTVGRRVTSIEGQTFKHCSSLKSVTIPGSVTSIGFEAFAGCTGLTTVNYRGSSAQWSRISVGEDNDPLQNAAKVYNYTGN